MRVALVSPYDMDAPGGVQSHVDHLAVALRRTGDEVTVIAPGTRDRDGMRRVGGSTRIPFNDSVAPLSLSPMAAGRTRRALRDIAPDVVHVHEPAVPIVGLAALSTSVSPVVATFHAWSDRDRLYRLVGRLLHDRLADLPALTAVSTAAQRYHAAALGLPTSAFRIVPNGVDVARFAGADPFPEIADDGGVLFVGRLESRKGLAVLMRAFALLKVERPGARLYVIGDGPERDRCREMLPARLRADAHFLGHVADEDLPRFYRSCSVFVAPALGGESFGIVLLEAMAAGLPVVASDIPGYRSVVSDGRQGRLVPPGDGEALAAAMASLLANPALREAMAAEGAATVTEFDWPVVARRVRSVYEDALDAG